MINIEVYSWKLHYIYISSFLSRGAGGDADYRYGGDTYVQQKVSQTSSTNRVIEHKWWEKSMWWGVQKILVYPPSVIYRWKENFNASWAVKKSRR